MLNFGALSEHAKPKITVEIRIFEKGESRSVFGVFAPKI